MKLTPENIREQLQNVNGWNLSGDEIRKQFQFADFAQVMTSINHAAELAEEANHHPDIDIRYNKVTLVLSTQLDLPCKI